MRRHPRPSRLRRAAASLAAALLAAGAGAGSSPEGAGEHPWHARLPAAPVADHGAPVEVTVADALDLSATLRGAAAGPTIGLTLRATYRLDAADYLARKRADADDLEALHAAMRAIAVRDATLAWIARRCEGAWRAWQVALLARTYGSGRHADDAYRDALRDVLRHTATAPATAGDVTACRLAPWAQAARLAPDAPEWVAAVSEANLARRATRLAAADGPPSAWFEVDAFASLRVPGSLSLRAGLDVPLSSVGGRLALGIGPATGADVALSWHTSTIDDRITARHRGSGGDATPDASARADTFERLVAEARLARADADLRWNEACGASTPAEVVHCLAHAAGTPSGDALIAVADAELAALHAELAHIAASGRDVVRLLRGEAEDPASRSR